MVLNGPSGLDDVAPRIGALELAEGEQFAALRR